MPTASALPLARRAVRTARLVASLALAALIGAACDGGPSADNSVAADLVGRFEARGRYVPLAEALALTGLDREIENGTFTILAPTETALRYIGSDFQPVLFAEPQRETLRRVLRHHIVAGRLEPEAFTDGATLTTLAGTTLRVRRIGPVVTVNGITVDVSDPLEGSNGVAYPAADVLLDIISTAERVRLSPLLSTLSNALRTTGVFAEAEATGPLTVLAPLNDGFAALGSGATTLLTAPANADIYRRVLRTLVLPGNVDLDALVGQTVTTLAGDRLPVTRDANRILYVGGTRVLRSETTQDGHTYLLGGPILSTLSVGERMRIRPDLTRFLEALGRLPLPLAAVSDRGQAVTVFAPSNATYSERPAPLASLLAEAAQASLVAHITGVHVVSGRYTHADLTDGLRLTASDGTVLTVSRNGDTVSIDGILVGESTEQANGVLFTSRTFLTPDVDLFETLPLRGYVGFFRAIRQLGLETDYRTRVRTGFVLTDEQIPRLLNRPDSEARRAVQRTATTAFIPSLPTLVYPYTFTALNGDTRTLNQFDCSVTGDGGCSPYGFELFPVVIKPEPGTEDEPIVIEVPTPQIYEGGLTQDQTAAFHQIR